MANPPWHFFVVMTLVFLSILLLVFLLCVVRRPNESSESFYEYRTLHPDDAPRV